MQVRPWRVTAGLGGAALLVALALGGCSAGRDDATSNAAAPAARQVEALDAAPGDAKVTQARAAGADLRVDQRSIIYTGSITVRVDDVNAAAARATAIATGVGGFVSGDKRDSQAGATDASLELRVPAEKFATVVDQLSRLGHEQERGINTKDVTEETLDLDARLATQQARVDSGRRLLAQAKSLNDLVMLEREVATREADLASLQAKKRHLADLIALSTITVVLLDPVAATTDEEQGGFLGGLRAGWHALLASLKMLLTVVGALLPWLVALGLPAWGVLWLIRRFGRRTPRPARAFASTGPTADTPATSSVTSTAE